MSTTSQLSSPRRSAAERNAERTIEAAVSQLRLRPHATLSSSLREPRREECTICTAVAPDAVLTYAAPAPSWDSD